MTEETDLKDEDDNSKTPPPRRSERHAHKVSESTDEKEYTIERLVGYSPGADGGDYKVRWHRCSPDDDLWLPAEEIPQHFRAAYHKRQEQKALKSERG